MKTMKETAQRLFVTILEIMDNDSETVTAYPTPESELVIDGELNEDRHNQLIELCW